jgi:hypothetical protein
MMSDALSRYRTLEDTLVFVRWTHRGLESEEEDALLDAMDVVWAELEEDEREWLQAEPPRSLIRTARGPRSLREFVDVDHDIDPRSTPRKRGEAA